jgi:branched-chain amino acid transport system ATP-binding protein
MKLLEIENVTAGYGNLVALRDVSLCVNEGEAVALIGANGAGKSTLLRVVSRLIPAISGTIRYKNIVINAMSPHVISRMGIAHVPEGRGIFGNLSVIENLQLSFFAAKKRDKGSQGRILSLVFDLFPVLGQRKKQPAATLSGGEQQMLAIGRAIISDGELLILDEPSMGLSPKFVGTVFSIVDDLNKQGKSVLLVEQNATLALRFAKRVYVIENGTIVVQGHSSEISANENLKRSYFGS